MGLASRSLPNVSFQRLSQPNMEITETISTIAASLKWARSASKCLRVTPFGTCPAAQPIATIARSASLNSGLVS